MKIMGLDFGKARIGVALSDIMGFLASPYTTLSRTTETEDLEFLNKIIKEFKVETVVMGYPFEMSGNKGETCKLVEDFAEKLKNYCDVKIVFVDERLSSVEAEEQLRATIKDWKQRKKLLDQVSASIILQTYLDSK